MNSKYAIDYNIDWLTLPGSQKEALPLTTSYCYIANYLNILKYFYYVIENYP